MNAHIKRFLPTFIVSSVLVILLSFISMGIKNTQGFKGEVNVFNTTQDKILTEEGIITYFTNYPLRCELIHIEWKSGLLYIQVNKLSNKEELYKDVYLILKECFVERENVKRVRFSVHREGEEPMLLDARKENVSSDPHMQGRDSNMSYEEYLEKQFHLHQTK